MKKASLVNLFVVVGLLALCVVTLVLVYAMAPESSVLLLEESFDRLDESKWRHEVAACEEDGEQFHYVTADEENRLIADGALHIYPNMTNVHFKTKREAKGKCSSCRGSDNSTADCISLFSAKLQSRGAFEAKSGRMEIRAKICCGGRINFNIGITPNQNESRPEEAFESLVESGNATTANTSRIKIFFELPPRKTFLTSAITDSRFHIYEINWTEESVSLRIDRKKVEERRLEECEENISNGTVKLDSGPISKAFYVDVGVRFEGKDLDDDNRHLNTKRSVNGSTDPGANNSDEPSTLEVDYIKIFKI